MKIVSNRKTQHKYLSAFQYMYHKPTQFEARYRKFAKVLRFSPKVSSNSSP